MRHEGGDRKIIVRWDEVSTVTGRQLEFETVDLEAIREAFRDHADREQSEAEKTLNDSAESVPDTDENTGLSDVQHEEDDAASQQMQETAESGLSSGMQEQAEPAMPDRPETEKIDFSGDGMESLTDHRESGADQAEADSVYLEVVIGQLSKKYEDKHRMSVELSSDVFTAIGKAKARARQEHEEAVKQAEEAAAVVDDATRKLKILEKRYEKARSAELLVKRELQSLPYVAEAAITEAREDIERDRDELAGFMRELPHAEQFELTARAEALTALKATLEPEGHVAEKKKALDAAEKLRDLTDYLLTVAKKSQGKEKLEAEYAAARREAAIRNAAYFEAYREYAKAESFLKDARIFAREKRNIYDAAHKETVRIRRKIDAITDLIEAEEIKVSSMEKASARYDEVFTEYRSRKKTRLVRGRQLDAAREEYARLLNVLAEAKNHAENAADRMYRAEKISVRDVIETDVKDPDFTYLNQYGALLSKAQADEQAALGELRRAQKNSDAV